MSDKTGIDYAWVVLDSLKESPEMYRPLISNNLHGSHLSECKNVQDMVIRGIGGRILCKIVKEQEIRNE